MENKYRELKEFLIKCNNEYYKNNNSLISDYEFDQKMYELRDLEEKLGFQDDDSPTKYVGSDLTKDGLKHNRPMLSLDNTYNYEDVAKWYKDVCEVAGEEIEVVVDLKYDGASCSIFFEDGKVVKALTRGNGEYGEDITRNVSICNDLWNLDYKGKINGEFRGELIMSKYGFSELSPNGEYKNPRNLLSGTIKLLDENEFKERFMYINLYSYWSENTNYKKYSQDLEFMNSKGLKVGRFYICKNLEQIIEALVEIETKKDAFDVELDGAVMKVNDKTLWDKIGSTAKCPKWAKSFKFKQEELTTKIIDIEYQVGRTGKVTPVAILEPVELAGTTVTRATLNNKEYIELKDVRINDIVKVRKAAAIIPEIVSVVLEDRSNDSIKTEFIKFCPICGEELIQKEDFVDIFCDNNYCEARVLNNLEHHFKTMEIDGIGPALLKLLLEEKNINDVKSFYEYFLENDEWKNDKFGPFGNKSLTKIYEEIQEAKNQDAWRLLASFGIKRLGKRMSKVVLGKFENIKNLIDFNIEDMISIEGIEEKTAQGIKDWFSVEKNINLIEYLEKNNFNLIYKIIAKKVEKSFNICITGSLSVPRKFIEEKIIESGHKLVTGVTSTTDYLVNNDIESNSSKNKKAKELGKPIISELDLLNLLN